VWWVTLLHIYHSVCWWNIFLNWWTFGEVTGKMVDCFMPPFALHFCSQRCWSRQINWMTCVLRTETVSNRCYVNRQVNVSLLSTNIKLLCRPLLTNMTDRLTPSVTDRLLTTCGILLRKLFFVVAVVYGRSWDFGIHVTTFVSEFNNVFLQTFILKQCLSG